jgi:hypothetical protein
MLIRSRMGVSVDGFVATPDGLPAWLAMPGFVPGVPHGFQSSSAGATRSSWAAPPSCQRSAHPAGHGRACRSTC